MTDVYSRHPRFPAKLDYEQPSADDWSRLLRAAIAFRDLAPWHWMEDDEVFAVVEPESGVTGYCCVMGAAGQVFGLGVYPGAQGLQTYVQTISNEFDPDDIELQAKQVCLLASFEDREVLDPEDRALIKSAGLKVRGRGAWPHLRSHYPGYHPSLPSRSEALLLTVALEQAVLVAPRVAQGLGLIHESDSAPDDYEMFTRAFDVSEQRWKDALTTLPPPPSLPALDPVDQLRLARIREHHEVGTAEPWEVDLFFMPTMVIADDDDHRWWYPRMWMVVDSPTGVILDGPLMEPWKSPEEMRDVLLDVIERAQGLPDEVYVKSEDALWLTSATFAQLGISVRLEDELPGVEDAQEALYEYTIDRAFGGI